LTQLAVNFYVCRMTQLPALLTTGQVADLLCVSDDTVHRWAREGKLRAIELPSGLKRFKREDIEAILDGSPAVSVA